MSNLDSTTISDLLAGLKWPSRTTPIFWVNDETKLNAANLNTMSSSINDLRDITSNNNDILKSAISATSDEVIAIIGDMEDIEGRLSAAETNISGILGDGTIGSTFGERLSAAESTISSINSSLTKASNDISTIRSTLGERLIAAECEIDSIDTALATVQNYVTSTEEGGLQYILNKLETGVNSKVSPSDLSTEIGKINTSINELSTTISGAMATLKGRISALEDMIASGTEDPENADLDDKVQYYIKYEE